MYKKVGFFAGLFSLMEVVHAHPKYVLCPVYLSIVGETSSGQGWGSSSVINFFVDYIGIFIVLSLFCL